MKKILLFLLVPTVALAGSYRVVISSRFKALPARPMLNAQQWATNTYYTQGTYIRNYGEFFMAISSGTSSLAGTGPHFSYSTTNDNTVSWYAVPSKNRNGLYIQNISGGNLTVGLGDQFVTNSQGIVISAGNDLFMQNGVFQGEVYLISTNSTATVTEW